MINQSSYVFRIAYRVLVIDVCKTDHRGLCVPLIFTDRIPEDS